MKNELRILIEHLERLQESLQSFKEIEGRVDKLEKFVDYLKGMMAAGVVIAAAYGYMLFEVIKKVL